jgi:alpha-ketoglutarate-dependent taurine dioxygenase
MRLHVADPTPEQVAGWRQRAAREQPLVWTHRDGRKSLVLGATAEQVVGMDAEEGRSLLDGLLTRATRPERVYRHEWKLGDVVMWDNRGVLHRAASYDPSSRRDMHRTTFAGDEPIS